VEGAPAEEARVEAEEEEADGEEEEGEEDDCGLEEGEGAGGEPFSAGVCWPGWPLKRAPSGDSLSSRTCAPCSS